MRKSDGLSLGERFDFCLDSEVRAEGGATKTWFGEALFHVLVEEGLIPTKADPGMMKRGSNNHISLPW